MMQLRKLKNLGTSVLAFWFFMTGPSAVTSQEWQQYKDVDRAGWSKTELDGARQYATEIGSAAVMIVENGNVVAAWGNIEHPYKAASIRKSIDDATIGATIRKKKFDVNSTLAELKIDDRNSLSNQEKQATFEHLMTARSGVYHPAAYETASNANRRPERNSAAPGEKWYYNNWDFNVLAPAYKKLAGISLNQGFKENLATPMGFEDFEPDHIFEWFEPRTSRHSAKTFRISARDLARIGKLYLQKGIWNGNRIVSSKWVKKSIKPHTIFEKDHDRGEGNGYGRLWWFYPARPESDSPFEKHLRIAARGTGEQLMILFPKLDLLIVHRTDTDQGRGASGRDVYQLMNMIIASRKRKSADDANIGPVQVKPLSGKKPIPLRKDYSAVPENQISLSAGTYMFNKDLGLRLYKYDKRLFIQPLGMARPDAEVFVVSDGTLRSPLVNLIIRPIKNGDKKIDSLEMTFGGRTLTGKRVE